MLDQKLMQSALDELCALRTKLLEARHDTDENHPRYHSLLNLKQYRILRSSDWTRLQEKLFSLSLSSLGRSYAHVAASIDTLYDQLSSSLGQEQISEAMMAEFHHLDIHNSIAMASRNSQHLFGGKASSKLSKQSTSIMVTLPSHAAENDGYVIKELSGAGVNVFRINTAHDNAAVWRAMAEVIAEINAQREEADKIKIFVDLAGPKIRTGRIKRLDMPLSIGSNKRETKIVIVSKNGETRPKGVDSVTLEEIPAQIAIEKSFFKKIKEAHHIKIIDVNGKKAFIEIKKVGDDHIEGIIDKKVFINEETSLYRKRHSGKILNVQKQIDPIRLFMGDFLVIAQEDQPGHSAVLDDEKNVLQPALISCSLKGIGHFVKEGNSVYIDDGKIALEVLSRHNDAITCKVTLAKSSGTLLKEEKGINFPDSHIKTDALTQTDKINLLSVLDYVDTLSVSFCQNANDIKALQVLLKEHNRSDVGIIAKIETKQAVKNMPEILEQLLEWEKSGVMIARGDLAIEVGFANMAYIQEALLDICNATHMPVIWATQVLESKMKNNLPSRAEVSDAAMAGRAECVMLNKGAFATDTIDVLVHILDDMHSLFKKNRQLLKKETLW